MADRRFHVVRDDEEPEPPTFPAVRLHVLDLIDRWYGPWADEDRGHVAAIDHGYEAWTALRERYGDLVDDADRLMTAQYIACLLIDRLARVDPDIWPVLRDAWRDIWAQDLRQAEVAWEELGGYD